MHPEIGKFTAFGQMAYKLLTTITLLCFSIAANADIYFCQARHYAEANQNFTMTVNKEALANEIS